MVKSSYRHVAQWDIRQRNWRRNTLKKNQKDTYDMDDIINVYRKSGNFKGNHACGLSNIPNGKTTAFQNA